MCHAREHTPRGAAGGGFRGRTSCFNACPGAKGGRVGQQSGQDARCHGPSPPWLRETPPRQLLPGTATMTLAVTPWQAAIYFQGTR